MKQDFQSKKEIKSEEIVNPSIASHTVDVMFIGVEVVETQSLQIVDAKQTEHQMTE